ncbi:Shugoshin, N-terminal [Penicillium italicum]|uniref:Shugoshin, N-terminal n=1 Tax=Penicillium italicum TaxID=40296 RepID=A0A0A2LD61_PENIT|nr:Shugoshin, N-terminal [Penicillium italicum]
MARLNDYAAPAESIDALKRRFVRQNREIARVNSLQSLRIRSLESEVSHLLSENVSLRKQVINLTQETERLEAGKMLHNGIYDIKSKLDAKIAELSSLAADLGSLPRKIGKLCDEQFDRPKQAAGSRPRAEDSMEGEDGRLPVIVEDKYYPRQTLEPQELDSLINDEHSILGSPPQFSFMLEEADASVEHSSPSPPKSTFRSPINNGIPEELEPLLPPTLETRKKKKKSSSIMAPEISPAPTDRQPSPSIDTTQDSTSVSTKRKYIPEDDDRFTCNLDVDDDEFQFTRPSHSPKKKTNPFEDTQRDQAPTKSHVEVTRGSKPPALSMRKVLEPKSANSNLGSPKKARMSSYQESKLMQRSTKGDENNNSPQKAKDVEKLIGKTANPNPRLSKTAPSNKEKRASRSAPPQLEEPALHQPALSPHPNTMSTGEESAIRPSRRRGAVVSYAEPNLRDKMRRPTKELIDAVALGSRRSSSFQAGRESLEGESTQPHGTYPADFAFEAQSADLPSVDGSSEQLLAMVSRRKRKVSSTPKDDSDAGNPSSGLKKEIEDSLADISAQVSQKPLNTTRQTRRHSSNPKITAENMTQYEIDQGELQSPIGDSPEEEDSFGPNGSITSDVRRGQRVAARRKSMMV